MESLRRFKLFCSETWSELKKTSWPGRKEVYGTTVVVIVTVLIFAVFLFMVDQILGRAFSEVLGFFQ